MQGLMLVYAMIYVNRLSEVIVFSCLSNSNCLHHTVHTFICALSSLPCFLQHSLIVIFHNIMDILQVTFLHHWKII